MQDDFYMTTVQDVDMTIHGAINLEMTIAETERETGLRLVGAPSVWTNPSTGLQNVTFLFRRPQ